MMSCLYNILGFRDKRRNACILFVYQNRWLNLIQTHPCVYIDIGVCVSGMCVCLYPCNYLTVHFFSSWSLTCLFINLLIIYVINVHRYSCFPFVQLDFEYQIFTFDMLTYCSMPLTGRYTIHTCKNEREKC